MKLVLLEFIDEAENILKDRGRDFLKRSDVRVVSLSPNVEAFLKRQGLECENTVPFFTKESHCFNVERTEKISSILSKEIFLKDSLGLTNAYQHFMIYHLKFWVSYFIFLLQIFDNILKKYSIKEVYCFSHGNFVLKKAFIDDQERFLGQLAQRFFGLRGIKVHCQLMQFPKKTQGFLNAISIRLVGLYFRIYFLLLKKFFRTGKPIVVVPTWGYKFDDLLNTIRQKFPTLTSILIIHEAGSWKRQWRLVLMSLAHFLPFLGRLKCVDIVVPISLLSNARNQYNDIALEEGLSQSDIFIKTHLRNLLSYSGVNFGDIFIQKLSLGFTADVRKLCRDTRLLADLYERFKPQFVMSPFSTGLYYAMGELANRRNIESCVISHGSHMPPNNRYEEIENYWLGRGVILNDYRAVAVQTPWTKKFLEYYGDKRQWLYTGPLIFSRRKRGQKPEERKKILALEGDKKVLLYAATQRVRYGPRFYITETLDEFISSLQDLVRVINEIEQLYLIIRPHPTCNLKEEDYRILLPQSSRYRVLSKGSFEDALSLADLLVSYSSTCVEEALNNDIPVVLYDRWQRYNHFNLEPYTNGMDIREAPVVYIDNYACLKKYFSTFVRMRQISSDYFEEYRYGSANNEAFYKYIEKVLEGARKI